MVNITSLTANEAKFHFLKGESYFNSDTPPYMKFDKLLAKVESTMDGKQYSGFKEKDPASLENVNHRFITNKDGRFAWRQLELIHPVIYVSLVNLICQDDNWDKIQNKFKEFSDASINCASIPRISPNAKSDKSLQVQDWWQEVEQESIKVAIEFKYHCSADVADCYGSLYTHSISWAIDGYEKAKKDRSKAGLGADLDLVQTWTWCRH